MSSLDTIGISRPLAKKETNKSNRLKTIERLLKKRAAKAITKESMWRLFGLQSPLNDDYRQAYRCNDYLFEKDGKLTSNYCQKRCCTVCSRIKSKQSLVKYTKPILLLDNLYLVSLTNKNVYKGELSQEVDRMFLALTRIKKNIDKNYKENKLNGYRTFECTHSLKTGFNPHFHFIVETKEAAELLVALWLKQFPLAKRGSQDITHVEKKESNLLEVFKYIAKPVTKGYYSCAAFDEIMISIKGKRVSDPLGKVRGYKHETEPIGLDLELDEMEPMDSIKEEGSNGVWTYDRVLYDYLSKEGELYIGTPIDKKTLNAILVIQNTKIEDNEKGIKIDSKFMYENRQRDNYLF